MSHFLQKLKCPNGFSLCFVIATLLLIGLLLLWHSTSQYHQYLQHQKQLTKQSVTGTAKEISAHIEYLRHQVKIFTQDRLDIIRQLAQQPENYTLFTELNRDAAAHFPDYFAITIADSQGVPLIGNYDLLVNELCQTDIMEFVKSGFNYDIFMHPHPEAQHFDLMMPVDLNPEYDSGGSGVFFISFRPTLIQRFLGNAEIYGHNLYLLKNNIKGLIELTAEGTRIDLILQNKNHILTADELERIDYLQPVDGTRWNLVGIADATLYSDERNKITRRAIYIFTAFLTISLMYLVLLKHLEKKRRLSEEKLNQVKEQLQHTLNFSNVCTWNYNLRNKTFEWPDDARSILTVQAPKTLDAYLQITHPDDRENVNQFLAGCAATGRASTLEHRVLATDNTIHWLELAASVDKCDVAKSHILGLIRDITARKQAEHIRLQHEKEQRDMLIREVHHRIKNNLQGVIGLLLRHSKQGNLNQSILKHAISQLNSVSLIHGLSGTTDSGRIYLSDLILTIINAANNFTGATTTLSNIPSEHHCWLENEDDAVAIALIVNELVFNAIKHAPVGIAPDISLICNDESATFTIINRAKSNENHFDYDNQIGLGSGLKLVKSLLPKKGAKLMINRLDINVVTRLILKQPVILTAHDNDSKTKQIA